MDQVPPISYLNCTLNPLFDCFNIWSGSITTDNYYYRIRNKPVGQCFCCSVWQNIDGFICVELNQDCAKWFDDGLWQSGHLSMDCATEMQMVICSLVCFISMILRMDGSGSKKEVCMFQDR
jgi:hypothetical protein